MFFLLVVGDWWLVNWFISGWLIGLLVVG